MCHIVVLTMLVYSLGVLVRSIKTSSSFNSNPEKPRDEAMDLSFYISLGVFLPPKRAILDLILPLEVKKRIASFPSSNQFFTQTLPYQKCEKLRQFFRFNLSKTL